MTNKYFYLFAAVVLSSVLFSSCRARFYTPNRHPVPLFRNAGDMYFDASTNMFNKGDVTAGAAISKNIAAYAGIAVAGQNFGSDTGGMNSFKYRGNMLNVGLGYFINQDQSENFRFEIFGDYGNGNFKNTVSGQDNTFFNGRYQRIGIMPTFGYRSSDNMFAVGYSARFSQIRFYNEKLDNPIFWSEDLKRYNSKPSYALLEHALSFRFGGEKLKFQIQMAGYQGINAAEITDAIPHFNFALMAGAVFEINAPLNKK
jgi:hypothetical protein